MKQVLYSKYNRTRKKEFQIGTKIYVENGKKYVEKYALEDEAIAHIHNIGKWNTLLGKAYTNVKFQKAMDSENDAIVFEYLEGKRISDELSESIDNKDVILAVLHRYMDEIFQFNEEYIKPFKKTESFKKVFGDVDVLDGMDATILSNVDMIFDNVFLCEDGMYLIDNEWGFDFSIPIVFLKYRTLFYFYGSNHTEIEKWMTKDQLFAEFGISVELSKVFEQMEVNMQKYIHGSKYINQYIQNVSSFTELIELKEEAMSARKLVPELQHTVEERNMHIKNLDDHIEHLDGIVAYYAGKEKQYIEENEKLVQKSNQLNEQYNVLNERYEELNAEYGFVTKDNDAKQIHINHIEGELGRYKQETERLTNELQMIAYYRKHPFKRMYKVIRRIGGKVWRKLKKMIRKVITPSVYRVKVVVPTYKNPKVSIVIPVYNEFQYTYDCIRTLVQNIKNVSYEIIVGDDESTDDTKKIKNFIKNVKVNINHTDHGFLMNCNRAAELAEGEYIVFLNNDTLVMENWLESLVELIESDEQIGMVGSKLIYPDGRLQEAGGILWKDASAWNYGRYQDANMPEYNYVRECDYISGASIMIRSELWKEIGGFDQRFIPAYCEDSDLAFEVRKHGYKVMYQPKSVVMHFEGISNGTELDSGLKKYQVENNVKFKEKWADELEKHNENAVNPFKMRERNFDKKTILFIDHYVPTYDKDAGSKTTFQYIKMFLAKGYVVKFIGDNYAQMEPYTTTLQQMGVEVLYGPWYAQHIFEWIEENKDNIDFAYLNRPHISVKYIDFLREKTDIKLIYYGHDLHFLRTEREAEITGNKDLLVDAKAWRAKEFDLMNKVSMSYYPSPVEEEAIHAIDPKIPVKAITAYVFDKFIENYTYDAEKRNGILFVGGFSHGPNVDAVKWFVEEIYTKVREKKDIPFIIVGSNAPEEIKALGERDGIIFKGFVSDEELAELYKTSRMVVVPLRYGAGVKGKVVEAIYNGLPIVTTSVGAEGIEGVEEVLCVEDNADLFAENIVALYDDAEKLSAMGNKTQEYIKEHFSVDAVWNIVKDDFQ